MFVEKRSISCLSIFRNTCVLGEEEMLKGPDAQMFEHSLSGSPTALVLCFPGLSTFCLELIRTLLNKKFDIIGWDRTAPIPPRPAAVLLVSEEAKPIMSARLGATKANFPDSKLIMLAGSNKRSEVIRLLRLGADTVIPPVYLPELSDILFAVLGRNQTWLPEPALLDSGLDRINPHEMLTNREDQVCSLIERRYSNQEIANALDLTESTVKFHVQNLFSKLGIKTRRELYAENRGSILN
jgi:DNA-binding NarL/FixJ family response regulator